MNGPKPSIKGIDWTAPAVDLHDELVERWFAANGDKPEVQHLNSDQMFDLANEWADTMIAEHAE